MYGYILDKINCDKYQFIRTNYDRIKKIEGNNKINYIYDVFVAETSGISVSLLKFKVDVVLFNKPDKKFTKSQSLREVARFLADFMCPLDKEKKDSYVDLEEIKDVLSKARSLCLDKLLR